MGDHARIAKDFHLHPKVQKCSNGAIGLWAKANSFTRFHRQAGFISDADALTLGTPSEVCELLDSELWDDVPGGFLFHDWPNWNSDAIRAGDKSSAQYMVDTKLYHHPQAVRDKLAAEVLKLIEEGIQTEIILAALDKWNTRDGAPPVWLGLFASDVIRSPEHHLEALLYQVRDSGEVSRLREHGHVFPSPDIPAHLKGQERRDFVSKAKRDWVDGLIRQRKLW